MRISMSTILAGAICVMMGVAQATPVVVTWTGTATGVDKLDVFGLGAGSGGAPDSSFTGVAYTATYRFDTDLGNLTFDSYFQALRGGTYYLPLVFESPAVSASITINGHSVSAGREYFAGYEHQAGPDVVDVISTEVQSKPSDVNPGATDILFNRLIDHFGALPLSLTDPFEHAIAASEGDGYFQKFTDAGDPAYASWASLEPAWISIAPVVDPPPPPGVPEPTALGLVALGLLSVALTRVRHDRSSRGVQ